MQVAPEQQPDGQLSLQPEQDPPAHACPDGQLEQACPEVPQLAGWSPGLQTAPSQQPLAHDAAVHLHSPIKHSCPI